MNNLLDEQILHNHEMEIIENKKAWSMMVYNNIQKMITLSMSAQKIYNQMKEMMVLLEQIVQVMLLSCIKCFDFPSMTEQD